MTPLEVREQTVRRLERDLIGPDRPDEVLEGSLNKPSDVYLTGILWPLGDRMNGADDDGSGGESEDDDGASSPTVVGAQRPCTMGLSFATTAKSGEHRVSVEIGFAVYVEEELVDEKGKRKTRWVRKAFARKFDDLPLTAGSITSFPVDAEGLQAKLELHVRTSASGSALLSTVTLINRSRPEERRREEIEKLTLFQTSLTILPGDRTSFVPRPLRPVANDEDEELARLLYRDVPEYAAGHVCSAVWDLEGLRATRIRSAWLPAAKVDAFKEDGHEVFADMVERGSFAAADLAAVTDEELIERLRGVPDAYVDWIQRQRKRVAALPRELRTAADRALQTCSQVASRIRAGVDAIEADGNLRKAFRLANAAMSLQHGWKPGNTTRPLKWRPFQLGFILLAAESTCNSKSPYRNVLDLLWFPTGGGKTEAYLAIIAILAFHRRLVAGTPADGGGNAAVMRYTLRLLTAQQFERAASLVLACELIRRGVVNVDGVAFAGNAAEFSIGLWVGGDATPNNFKKAMETRGQRDGCTAEQIDECPCCHGRVRWAYDEQQEKVQPNCENEECLVGKKFGLWPVFTVDSDVYREKPTLVIGTVDKFAILPTKKEAASLFEFGTARCTDLIIQDELHLISGPLGTIAGLYETAFDWLLTKDGHRPKVIGSTATIRRAAQQVRALFDRESCQFPPPGLDHNDSAFAVKDTEKEGRLYVGVTTAGRSAKFALQAVAGSLLQSAGPAAVPIDKERDGYSTLLAYFNSLRELGGAIVQMLDDVPDSMRLYSSRGAELQRILQPPRELTSRVSQKEIIKILGELKREAGTPDSVDVVLATNMVSVGVDVSRLGMMLVNGQPKTRSEYIQATSRVGRASFPGLIVSVLNSSKARDRSHYETFAGWHASLYRDVEATSVTPFASRARDRALHAVLVSMLRYSDPALRDSPQIENASDATLTAVVEEIERRIEAIDQRELGAARDEIDWRLNDWSARHPTTYGNRRQPNKSLLQSADSYAQRIAAGRIGGAAWPAMNNMRSVEPTTRYRMAEILANAPQRAGARVPVAPAAGPSADAPAPRWRRRNA